MSSGSARWPRRFVATIVARGVILVTVLLLAGCRGAPVGAEGTGDAGNGAPGLAGTPGAPGGSGAAGGSGAPGEPGAAGGSGTSDSESNSGAVTGSGHLIDRRLGLSGVTTLLVGAHFVVHVTVGEPEQATVRMDDNLVDLVDATVRGNQLRLGLKPGASIRNGTLSAEVTVRQLDRLTTSGVSQVTLASVLTGQAVHLEASGASQITGPVRVDRANASVSGTSTLALSGHVGHLDLSAAGTSALPLADLTVRDLDVALSGASHAVVTVQDTLAAQAAGVSTLRYRGIPRIIRQQVSGVASIAAQP